VDSRASIAASQGGSLMPHQLALANKSHDWASRSIWLSMAAAGCGFLFALWLYLLGRRAQRGRWTATGRALGQLRIRAFEPLRQFSLRAWYIDTVYDYAVVGTVLLTSRVVAWADETIIDATVNASARATVVTARVVGFFDRFVVDGIVTLLGATVQFLGLIARSVQSGRIQTYLAWVVASVIAIFLVIRYVVLGSIPIAP
jgi:hypothetical protein